MSTTLAKQLKQIRRRPENRLCADCGDDNATWASINLGIFICLNCSGEHRNLGVHISQVRSTTLDTWRPEWVQVMNKMGNAKSNSYYEAKLPRQKKINRSAGAGQRKGFIFSKYKDRAFYSDTPVAVEEAAEDTNNPLSAKARAAAREKRRLARHGKSSTMPQKPKPRSQQSQRTVQQAQPARQPQPPQADMFAGMNSGSGDLDNMFGDLNVSEDIQASAFDFMSGSGATGNTDSAESTGDAFGLGFGDGLQMTGRGDDAFGLDLGQISGGGDALGLASASQDAFNLDTTIPESTGPDAFGLGVDTSSSDAFGLNLSAPTPQQDNNSSQSIDFGALVGSGNKGNVMNSSTGFDFMSAPQQSSGNNTLFATPDPLKPSAPDMDALAQPNSQPHIDFFADVSQPLRNNGTRMGGMNSANGMGMQGLSVMRQTSYGNNVMYPNQRANQIAQMNRVHQMGQMGQVVLNRGPSSANRVDPLRMNVSSTYANTKRKNDAFSGLGF